MKKSDLTILAVAAVAVVAVVLVFGGGGIGGGGDDDEASGTKPGGDSLKVSFAYSPEKEVLLKPLIERFNSEAQKVGGKPVFVEAEVVSSGEAETKIAKDRLKPVIWSPASSLWGRLLNFDADRPFAARESPSIVRTPLVIAMWEPFARVLGYPKTQVGFEQIIRLARSKRGWAAFGKPEFGPFKLVHTNPDFSTSGLSAVVAEYYATTGKNEGLKEGDVTARKARETVRAIERSIVHYGDTTLFIADQMRKRGPGYASAVAMEEATLLEFNRNRGSQPKLVALYPPEGTFYSDNPFIVLDAPWVSSQEREGAKKFQSFLEDQITPERAAEAGFRPADVKQAPAAPITKTNGADPKQPQRVLGLPEPRVLDRIRRTWRADRKPANVLLVFDTSGSMAEEDRLERAKEGLKVFLREASANDRIGLVAFSDQVRVLEPVARPLRENRAKLVEKVDGLIADGGTAVYDATNLGFNGVRDLRDKERINAVVVLTDGEDTESSLSADEVVRNIGKQGDSEDQVRIFTIAYSPEASGAKEALERISKESGGQPYEGDTEDIESVYRSISSFF
ncbi:MAG: VWA domain-containing protein [Thermoleophilaceae bacterium]|nr:VWA domain-containing protein [Thermoleophilaceae bacterium]